LYGLRVDPGRVEHHVSRGSTRPSTSAPRSCSAGAARTVSGGFACVAGVGLTALALRDFWSYDARTDEHAVAERTARRLAGEGVDGVS